MLMDSFHERLVPGDCLVDFDGPRPLDLGETAEVGLSYAPTGVNLHDVFQVIENGEVTAVWPVAARGYTI
jgi:hypothetical protein